MPKIYQAWYKEDDTRVQYNGASQVRVEAEARTTAKERGISVRVDVVEIEKPSLKLVIDLMNGKGPISRNRVCVFEPREQFNRISDSGEFIKHWKVKRVGE
jgi:hypothetical protein